jgi:hypothetical protein
MDYSHGIRLVQNACVLNGTTPTTIQAVLQSSTLNPILSDEGSMSQPWYPYYVGTIATPTSFAVLKNSSSSIKLVVKNDPQATHYNVYTSSNGTSFGASVRYAKNNLFINGLSSGQITFIKISAYDSINNLTSGISELLAAIPSAQTDSILIVNGFDRAIAGNTYDFVRQHGPAIVSYGKNFESCTNEAVTDNLLQLSHYRIVDWILGEESTTNETFSSTEQTYVSTYLQQGGEFFTSGSEIGWDLDHLGSASDKNFYNNFFKASYVMDAPNNTAGSCYASLAQPLPLSIFGYADTVKFDNGTHGTYNVNYPDVVAAANGGVNSLRYTSSSSDIACVHFAGMFSGGTKGGKTVCMGFPFETIYTVAGRDSVMKYILDFFYDSSVQTTSVSTFGAINYCVFPNPSSGLIFVRSNNFGREELTVQLSDLAGRSFLKQNFQALDEVMIDASGLASGAYLLKINGQPAQKIYLVK